MNEFDELLGSIHKTLEKCPWMKEQTPWSFRSAIKSEAEEVAQAIDARDVENLKEELGDLIYDALCVAAIAEKSGHFSVQDVLSTVNGKIVRRKPWVFGDMVVNTPEEAVAAWNDIKKREKHHPK
jgi:tetrapyrrole methylase family protein / MazG family protein